MIGGRRARVAAIAVVAAAGALIALGTGAPSGAYWTATATPAPTAAGTGQWCASPDTTVASNEAIKLGDVATATGTNGRVAIIPVADNAAWGGGTANGVLTVTLWSCQDGSIVPAPAELANTVRITSWQYESTSTDRAFLAGTTSTVAPSSRLSPSSTLGSRILSLAQSASVSQLVGTQPLSRYSWIVAGGRSASAPTAAPTASCVLVVGLVCTVPVTNTSGGDDAFSQAFDTTPWNGSTTVAYRAATYAAQTPTGWSSGGGFNGCPSLSLLCTPTAANVTMTATAASDATLYASTNGNLLQWLVVQWNATSTATLTDDLVVQVSFT